MIDKNIEKIIDILKQFEVSKTKDYEKYASYINLIFTGFLPAKYIPAYDGKSLQDIISELNIVTKSITTTKELKKAKNFSAILKSE